MYRLIKQLSQLPHHLNYVIHGCMRHTLDMRMRLRRELLLPVLVGTAQDQKVHKQESVGIITDNMYPLLSSNRVSVKKREQGCIMAVIIPSLVCVLFDPILLLQCFLAGF